MGFYIGSDDNSSLDETSCDEASPPIFKTIGSAQETRIKTASGLVFTIEDGVPVAVQSTTARKLQLFLKRYAFDFPLAFLALVAFSPLLLVTAFAVYLSDGRPIFFSQTREGFRRRPFRLWKFRTMRTTGRDQTGVLRQETSRLGGFLRITSLDELPQLWNVLIGNMSIVGPRPMVPDQVAAGVPYRQLVPFYDARFSMRPGLTGWAQANGLRGPIADEAAALSRIEHDCAYIQNFSLLLDLKTVARTIRREFLTGTGS